MHFTTVFTIALAAASTSASLIARQLPNCAETCIATANLGGCISDDTHCLCSNSAFVDSTTTCIEQTCTGSDLQNALTGAQELCAAVGVTLTSTPTATGSSPASSSGAAASSATATGSSTPTASAAVSPSNTPTSSASSSASATTETSAAAPAHGANAFLGLVAVGLVALAL